MGVEGVAPLEVRLSGAAVTGVNPGWSGTVTADAPFAALALVRTGGVTWWGKAEAAPSAHGPITLYLHPLNHEGTSVQFLFSLGRGGVQEAIASIKPERLLAPSPATLQFAAGRLATFCTVASNPQTTFELFFLARSNVSAGRTGVWRPHKHLRGAFPAELETALFGSRHGSYASAAAV
jgi:hypothetical protein